MTQRTKVKKRKASSKKPFWRSLLTHSVVQRSDDKGHETSQLPVDPLRCDAPVLRHAEITAVYTGQRVAGDFYEFLRVGPSRMLFVLLDLAGSRADTREILIAVQKTFRTLAPILFAGEDFNETTAMIELCYAMNRTIMSGGLRSCPGFLGCYNEDLGTVCYANAGHTPALLRDRSGITLLEATGLPLGLFSHVTQSAAACHLVPGSALLLVSRGLIEADCLEKDGQLVEFGLERVRESFRDASVLSAHDVCMNVLQAVRQFTETAPTHDDLTTLALVRNAHSGAE